MKREYKVLAGYNEEKMNKLWDEWYELVQVIYLEMRWVYCFFKKKVLDE